MSWEDLEATIAETTIGYFGESVVYTPKGGSARTITAEVERNPPQQITPDGQVYAPTMIVKARNHATAGIRPPEINNGGDTITVAYRKGDTAQAWLILGEPLFQNAGEVWLALGPR